MAALPKPQLDLGQGTPVKGYEEDREGRAGVCFGLQPSKLKILATSLALLLMLYCGDTIARMSVFCSQTLEESKYWVQMSDDFLSPMLCHQCVDIC